MFLADQYKAIQAQNSDIKLLEIAANAIKEWDETASLQDKHTIKLPEKIETFIFSNAESSFLPPDQLSEMNMSSDLVPKESLSAYLLFTRDHLESIKAANPGLNLTEVSKILAECWRNIDHDLKAHYEADAEDGKMIHQQRTAFSKAQYGEREKKGNKSVGSRLANRAAPRESNLGRRKRSDDDDYDY